METNAPCTTPKPTRPLSAYNLYFQDERKRIQQEILNATGKKAHFTEVTKLVGRRWRKIGAQDKKYYETLAAKEKRRFALDMLEWQMQQESSPTNSAVAVQADAPSTAQVTRNPTPSSSATYEDHHRSESNEGIPVPGWFGSQETATTPLVLPSLSRTNMDQGQDTLSQRMIRHGSFNGDNEENELSLVDKLKALLSLANRLRLADLLQQSPVHPIEFSANTIDGPRVEGFDRDDVRFLEETFGIQHKRDDRGR